MALASDHGTPCAAATAPGSLRDHRGRPRRLRDVARQRRCGPPRPARRHPGRAVAAAVAFTRDLTPGERAAVVDGTEGRRRHQVYLRWAPDRRNALWEADHKELPVLVMAPRAQQPRKPWVTLFVDGFSRLIMGWALSLHPNAAVVLAALRRGRCRSFRCGNNTANRSPSWEPSSSPIAIPPQREARSKATGCFLTASVEPASLLAGLGEHLA